MLLERSSGTEWRKSVLMSCFIPNLAWWSDWTIRGSLINSSVAATFYWFGIDRVINARFNTTYRETVWGLGGMGLLLDHQTFLGLGVCFTPWGCMFTAQCWGWISTVTNHGQWWWVLPSVSTSVHICEVTTDQFHKQSQGQPRDNPPRPDPTQQIPQAVDRLLATWSQ